MLVAEHAACFLWPDKKSWIMSFRLEVEAKPELRERCRDAFNLICYMAFLAHAFNSDRPIRLADWFKEIGSLVASKTLRGVSRRQPFLSWENDEKALDLDGFRRYRAPFFRQT